MAHGREPLGFFEKRPRPLEPALAKAQNALGEQGRGGLRLQAEGTVEIQLRDGLRTSLQMGHPAMCKGIGEIGVQGDRPGKISQPGGRFGSQNPAHEICLGRSGIET